MKPRPLERSYLHNRQCPACRQWLREWERESHYRMNADCREKIIVELVKRFGYIRG